MKSANEMLAQREQHEDWSPLMEVAAREVFQLMLGCRLTVPDRPLEDNLRITSMVGLAGSLRGVLSIRCNHRSAALMTSKMLRMDVDKVGSELSDAMGEICNMVAGNFKNKIGGLEDGCMLSPPTVITGTDYDMHSLADSPAVELKLLFEGLPLVISLQIHG